MTATLFLGIWGAGVSTILALAKIIPEWPIVSIAPAVNPEDTPPSVTLIVFNPARRPLFIEGNRQFIWQDWWLRRASRNLRIFEQRPLEVQREVARAIDERKYGFTEELPRVFIPAGETAYLRVGETINYRLHYRGNRSKLSSYCGIGIGFFVGFAFPCQSVCRRTLPAW
jgi:hypothetical protein